MRHTRISLTRFLEEDFPGCLLQGVGSESGGSVSTGFGQASVSGNHAYGTGIGFSGNVIQKAGSGIAIYVEPAAAN